MCGCSVYFCEDGYNKNCDFLSSSAVRGVALSPVYVNNLCSSRTLAPPALPMAGAGVMSCVVSGLIV